MNHALRWLVLVGALGASLIPSCCSRSPSNPPGELTADPFPVAVPIDGWTETTVAGAKAGYLWSSEAPDRVFLVADAAAIRLVHDAWAVAARDHETPYVLLDSFTVVLPHASPYGISVSRIYARREDVPKDALGTSRSSSDR